MSSTFNLKSNINLNWTLTSMNHPYQHHIEAPTTSF